MFTINTIKQTSFCPFRKNTCHYREEVADRMTMTKDQAAEVERLESEARAKAAKHVANMLARPDQLEKVHQLTWRVSRWAPLAAGRSEEILQ